MNLADKVREVYSGIARDPGGRSPFPTGRALADDLGYPSDLLDNLPSAAVEAFCGVSNTSVTAPVCEGMTVLDLGCGAGLDSLIAAQRVGPSGRVFGVDFSPEMLQRAARAAEESGSEVVLELAPAHRLPLPEGSVDLALVNGIFNLNPDREALFRELFRVLRPGGTVLAAEIILAGHQAEPVAPSEDDWFR